MLDEQEKKGTMHHHAKVMAVRVRIAPASTGRVDYQRVAFLDGWRVNFPRTWGVTRLPLVPKLTVYGWLSTAAHA
jgi:hypothetical protein